MRILGIDPGLNHTGWGIIDVSGNALCHVANGTIHAPNKNSIAQRLSIIDEGLSKVIESYRPDHSAVEEVFVNANPSSTLKLGMARGVAILVPARNNLLVGEYAATLVKKSIVGSGHAGKEQMKAMVKLLLPQCSPDSDDAADALAVAICHAHHTMTNSILATKQVF